MMIRHFRIFYATFFFENFLSISLLLVSRFYIFGELYVYCCPFMSTRFESFLSVIWRLSLLAVCRPLGRCAECFDAWQMKIDLFSSQFCVLLLLLTILKSQLAHRLLLLFSGECVHISSKKYVVVYVETCHSSSRSFSCVSSIPPGGDVVVSVENRTEAHNACKISSISNK